MTLPFSLMFSVLNHSKLAVRVNLAMKLLGKQNLAGGSEW